MKYASLVKKTKKTRELAQTWRVCVTWDLSSSWPLILGFRESMHWCGDSTGATCLQLVRESTAFIQPPQLELRWCLCVRFNTWACVWAHFLSRLDLHTLNTHKHTLNTHFMYTLNLPLALTHTHWCDWPADGRLVSLPACPGGRVLSDVSWLCLKQCLMSHGGARQQK